MVMMHADAEMCPRKEIEKQSGEPNALQNNNTGDDCLPSDPLLTVDSRLDPTETASNGEGKPVRKKKKKNKKKKKRPMNLKTNGVNPGNLDGNGDAVHDNNDKSSELNHDFLDGSLSKKTTISEGDASLESCVGISTLMDSEKVSSHEGKKSPKKKKKKKIKRCKTGDIVHQDNTTSSELNPDCLNDSLSKKTIHEGDASFEVSVDVSSLTDSEKVSSHVGTESTQKKKNRKRRKKGGIVHQDNGRSSELSSEGLDECLSKKTTTPEGHASFKMDADNSSLINSEKIPSHVETKSSRKRKRKQKRKAGEIINQVNGKGNPDCLDGNLPKKATTGEQDEFCVSCVNVNSLADSEKSSRHVGTKSPQKKKKTRRRKNGNIVNQDNSKDSEIPECPSNSGDVLLEGNGGHQDSEKKLPEKNAIGGYNGKDILVTEKEDAETKMNVEEVNSSSLNTTKDNNNLNVKEERNHLELLRSPYLSTQVGCPRKKLLVLDLNGILVDIVSEAPRGYKHDKIISNKKVFKRPFCEDFLQFLFERFNVGVWSSRIKKNVDRVIDFVMGAYEQKLLFRWCQTDCTNTGFMTIENGSKPLVFKELKKLWEKVDPNLPWRKGEYNESNTILLDDSPYKALRNPPNTAIFPHPYQFKNVGDRALGPGGDLRVYLEGLASAENVQKYVEQNPFGQETISENHSSWEFYCRVMSSK